MNFIIEKDVMRAAKSRISFSMSYTPKVMVTPLTSKGSLFFILAFGLPFLGIGAWLIGGCLGIFEFEPGSVRAPIPILFVCGLIFFLPGVLVSGFGLKKIFTYYSKSNARLINSHRPWTYDMDWKKDGWSHSKIGAILYNIFGLGMVYLLFSPFVYFFSKSKNLPVVFPIAIGLMVLLFTYIGIKQILKAIRFSGVKCAYLRFPYFLGEEFEVKITGLPNHIDSNSIHTELRCLQSKLKESRHNHKNQRYFKCLYKDEQDYNSHMISRNSINIKFDIPQDENLGTDLIQADYIYWELRVWTEIPGVNFDYGFPVPIYRK